MNPRKFHEIWIEQCDAAQDIKLRHGLKAAFDYLVAEKLLYFASAAAARPELASELPRFVARVRGLFTPQEIRTHLERIEREQKDYAAAIIEDDDGLAEDGLAKDDFAEDDFTEEDELEEQDQLDEQNEPDEDRELIRETLAADAARARAFATVKKLLTKIECTALNYR